MNTQAIIIYVYPDKFQDPAHEVYAHACIVN